MAVAPQFKMMALLAHKGGAGKTTLAVHLAVAAQQSGMRTLLVDCDPQRSTSRWWRTRNSTAIAMVEAPPDRLSGIVTVARDNGIGLVIVDTRASVERDAGQVAWLADFCLIPTRPSILDLEAVGATVQLTKAAERRAAIILNACPPRTWLGEPSVTSSARRGLKPYGVPVSPIAVSNRVAFVHPLIKGLTAFEAEPGGKAAAEMQRVWEWLQGKLWSDEDAAAARRPDADDG
jgi:chromosome partitioning protein